VTLQTGDLAGFQPFYGEAGEPPNAAEKQAKALRCGHRGKPRGRAVAADGSVLADRAEEAVGSLVVVMPNEALAQAELASLWTRSGRSCLAHMLRLSGPSSAVYAVKITLVRVDQLLGPEAVDLHLLATRRRPYRRGSPGKQRRPFRPPPRLVYSVGAFFRVGAADIVFFTESERRRFPPATTEWHLLSLLDSRAKAHTL
jgi:hypothetical protein